ncbi:MAG: hypothetical protein HYU77_13060 [Betaproteobacteria bacterium]|nr:hypothetical protein [Betaproteobacteria bacterium]
MRFRSGLLQFCLALALLLAQQGGYWHALTHLAAEASSPEQGQPESKACPLDAVYAKVGSGMAPAPLAVVTVAGADAIAALPESLIVAPAPAPDARAPPPVL